MDDINKILDEYRNAHKDVIITPTYYEWMDTLNIRMELKSDINSHFAINIMMFTEEFIKLNYKSQLIDMLDKMRYKLERQH